MADPKADILIVRGVPGGFIVSFIAATGDTLQHRIQKPFHKAASSKEAL
jgi:hypothetical protein